jgi:ABC-type phosphate/phosphonate transport system ATPase subunit
VGIGIQVEGLTKSFGPQRIWEDVTMEVPPGEVSVLLGPSGTGKSVFLKSLIGLLRPERGKIIVDGTNIIECSASEQRNDDDREISFSPIRLALRIVVSRDSLQQCFNGGAGRALGSGLASLGRATSCMGLAASCSPV